MTHTALALASRSTHSHERLAVDPGQHVPGLRALESHDSQKRNPAGQATLRVVGARMVGYRMVHQRMVRSETNSPARTTKHAVLQRIPPTPANAPQTCTGTTGFATEFATDGRLRRWSPSLTCGYAHPANPSRSIAAGRRGVEIDSKRSSARCSAFEFLAGRNAARICPDQLEQENDD
jgi:hypothetical protein